MTLFFLLGFICIISSILLITNKNPVYSVLCLVLLFICGSILLLVLGADFLGFVFILVYVGAVAVLFLFVVIILDIKLASKANNLKQIPLVFLIFLIVHLYLNFLVESYTPYHAIFFNVYTAEYQLLYGQIPRLDDTSSISTLGQVLYSEYIIHFVIGGLVLLVAMIGAIVLTSRRKQTSLKQKVFKQVERLNIVGKNKNL
jgi:NADH-quinone oxidoreductase subunit J